MNIKIKPPDMPKIFTIDKSNLFIRKFTIREKVNYFWDLYVLAHGKKPAKVVMFKKEAEEFLKDLPIKNKIPQYRGVEIIMVEEEIVNPILELKYTLV